MKTSEAVSLYKWLSKNADKIVEKNPSYTKLAAEAAEVLGCKVTTGSVKSTLAEAGIELVVSRGPVRLKSEVESLQVQNGILRTILLDTIGAGEFLVNFVEEVINDEITPDFVRDAFQQFLNNRDA